MEITVRTFGLKMRQVEGTDYRKAQWVSESDKRIDWSNSSDRKWLTNHQHWAMNNGRKVEISPDNAHSVFRRENPNAI